MKTPYLFLIFLISFVIYSCENPWMDEVLQPKTITFESNGGSAVPSQTLYKGERVQRPADPYKAGSTFAGWYTDNGTFEELYYFEFVPTHDMTLYAKWGDAEVLIPTDPNNPILIADNFYIEGLGIFDFDGNSKAVTVTPNSGITSGKITVFYEGIDNTKYSSTTPPSQPGNYKVTFDVEESEDWNAAEGLYAGTLVIQITAEGFEIFLNLLGDSSITNPKTIALNISNSADLLTIRNTFQTISDKFFILDLSGSTITEIPNDAFFITDEDKTLVGVTLPDSVIKIGDNAFRGCEGLTSIEMPNVISIGSYAFSGCFNLIGITMPKVTDIKEYAFYYCKKLKNVDIPNGVKSITEGAFWGCEDLESIIIPANVTSIEEKAFEYCDKLTKVEFKGEIYQSNFDPTAFPDGLYNVIYSTATNIGTPGTYERQTGGTWVKI